MSDVFDFYVYDDRSIQYVLAEPIMLEDKDVTQFRFRIPKSLNGFDMTGWAWWFVYVNAKGEKYSVPLELADDEDEPEEYSVATFSINYGITGSVGTIKFAIEVIDADTNGEILHEWHTRTYTTSVTDTLQGNQAEFAETESDVISALIVKVQELVAQGGLDATDVTSGYVPTADGNDGWSWQAQQGGGGGSVTVDAELSGTSTNPVQNKVISANINSLTDQLAQKGTYSKPSGGIPKSDLASAVQTSLDKADTALQTAPVTSVNGQTGEVTTPLKNITRSNTTSTETATAGGTINMVDSITTNGDGQVTAVNTKTVTLPQGGGGTEWTQLCDVTTTEEAILQIPITGISVKEVRIYALLPKSYTSTVTIYCPLNNTEGNHYDRGYGRPAMQLSNSSASAGKVCMTSQLPIMINNIAENQQTEGGQYYGTAGKQMLLYGEPSQAVAGQIFTSMSIATYQTVPAGLRIVAFGR